MMRFLAHLLLILLFAAGSVSAGTIEGNTSYYVPDDRSEAYPLIQGEEVENVILLIGDGMGVGQIYGSRLAAVGPDGKLTLELLPVTGLMTTHCADKLITDSAASGTAIATGHKTNYRMIGMLPDSTVVPTLWELAAEQGKATGIIATSALTHATPAAFASHVHHRHEEPTIAMQMANSRMDLLLGGGAKFWLPRAIRGSEREDDLDVIQVAMDRGFHVVRDRTELLEAGETPLLGLFGMEPLEENPDVEEPSLPEMTQKAIELLSEDQNGFFLMVEGSQIDWAGHDNEEDDIVRRTLVFDQAVRAAVRFALEDRKTLVLVTADHETGGMTIVKGDRDGGEAVAAFSTTGHTAGPVPVFAFGPGAMRFTGVFDNADLPWMLSEVTGVEGLTPRKVKPEPPGPAGEGY